jgi:hypothetical protein
MPESTSIATRVLDGLASAGALSAEQLASASPDAGRTLLSLGLVSAEQIEAVLEDELGTPRVDLASYAPDDDALARIPAEVAHERRVAG